MKFYLQHNLNKFLFNTIANGIIYNIQLVLLLDMLAASQGVLETDKACDGSADLYAKAIHCDAVLMRSYLDFLKQE